MRWFPHSLFVAHKTFMCFVTSWLVPAFGEPFSFTPWGIVSAFFWVPAGVAAIFNIKTAGLAVAMGTLSSFIVLVSFVWGIFVFEEQIHSPGMACFVIFLMMMGLCGVSYYSSLQKDENRLHQQQSTTTSMDEGYSPLEHEEEADSVNIPTASDDNRQECTNDDNEQSESDERRAPLVEPVDLE